jgi:hypothetical protein
MRVILIAGLIGLSVAAVAGTQPAAVWETYRALYPSDPAQRHALDRCFLEDRRFDRLDPKARAQCYRQTAPVRTAATSDQAASTRPREGFVDLRRAADQGRMSQNDVRTTEQNQRYLKLLAAGRTP